MAEDSENDIQVADFLEYDELPKRLFAVGDIHGCVEELSIMLEYLSSEVGFSEEDRLIFIGDYIDRGAASREVIDTLISFRDHHPESVFFLRGNHEDMLLSYLGFDGSLGEGYLVNGGETTLQSYGVKKGTKREKLLELLPEEHVTFFRELNRYIIWGDFVFAHAGLNPLRDLRFQLDEDLFWIRDEFINNLHYFKKAIVFGHTPFEDVLFHLPYKIGLDTGLVYGNCLTCVEVVGGEVFQLGTGESDVERFSFREKGGLWPEFG